MGYNGVMSRTWYIQATSLLAYCLPDFSTRFGTR